MSSTCRLCGAGAPAAGSGGAARCPACGAMLFAAGGGPLVLVAHGSEALSEQIGVAIGGAGMTPVRVARGDEALAVFSKLAPRALVLDVALDEVMAFQIIDWVRTRSEHRQAKVVLVASVFNRTAYKRKPSSLYGADDYVEQHHIGDELPRKLRQLLGLSRLEPAAKPAVTRELDARHDLAGRERVRALARQIVSDIALYHQEDIARAARGEPASGLSAALDEGRQLLAELVDPRSYSGEDPILDAFRSMLAELAGVVG